MSAMPTPPIPLTRRSLLARCASACALAALGPLASACASMASRVVRPVDGRVELALAQHPELADAGGSLKLLPEGQEDAIYVLSQPDGSFAALSPICTHLGCTVEVEGERLVCPCHGSTYDRLGTVLQGPAEEPLRRYRTHVTNDRVLVIDLRGGA